MLPYKRTLEFKDDGTYLGVSWLIHSQKQSYSDTIVRMFNYRHYNYTTGKLIHNYVT